MAPTPPIARVHQYAHRHARAPARPRRELGCARMSTRTSKCHIYDKFEHGQVAVNLRACLLSARSPRANGVGKKNRNVGFFLPRVVPGAVLLIVDPFNHTHALPLRAKPPWYAPPKCSSPSTSAPPADGLSQKPISVCAPSPKASNTTADSDTAWSKSEPQRRRFPLPDRSSLLLPPPA